MTDLGADTDKLRSDHLRAAQARMHQVAQDLAAGVAANMPLATKNRSKVDEDIAKSVAQQNQAGTTVVNLLVGVAGGNTENVDTLARLLAEAEADNIANAGGVTDVNGVNGVGRH